MIGMEPGDMGRGSTARTDAGARLTDCARALELALEIERLLERPRPGYPIRIAQGTARSLIDQLREVIRQTDEPPKTVEA